ncbi:H-NS family nucleoid-associated regulatory protein [Paraburkholderia sp. GAS199]|uniref:H-NS family nucleoid-associated regulatory protein n=1 Tax=Paraburkholderia sp. GAS199 TaxID=3035126 RepID=UPI003D23D62E
MSTLIARPDTETRERLILWIRKRMDECGITLAALERAMEEEIEQARHLTRYQDASGNCWSGEGSLPEWLRRAVAAGQSIEHFRSESA